MSTSHRPPPTAAMGQFNGHAGMDMANLPHDDVSQALTITSGVLSVLAVLLVAGRVYGRAVLLRIFWWDDFCMLVATVGTDAH